MTINKDEFGVTIDTKLHATDIRDNCCFCHVMVLDIRQGENGLAYPIEEITLRKVANFQVGYEQMPIDFKRHNSRLENDLYRTITEQRGNVLVLTQEPAALARFCQDMNIPFSNKSISIVATETTSVEDLSYRHQRTAA